MTANTPLSIAIVGAGYWGPNWIRTILGCDVAELAVVCDSNPNRLEFVTANFPEVPTSGNFDSVVNRQDINAIIIATPPESHETLSVSALNSGKHVLVEKPMATTVAAANNLVAAATSRDRVLAVGHVFAYHPAVIAMQQTLATGELGGLKYANSTRMNMPPPNPKFSVIWDLAVHDVSIALTLNNARPIRVSANGRNFRQGEICDAATISIEFDDDTMSWHHVGWLSAQRARRFFVGCQLGSMEFDDTLSEGKLKIFGNGIDSRSQGGNHSASALEYSVGDVLEPVLDSTSPLETELRQFAIAINGGAPPTADGVQGLRTVEVLAAAEESLERSGEPVMIDRIIQQIGK